MNSKETVKLLEPASVNGKLWLANRMVMPAMATLLGHVGGAVSEELIRYYRRRAAGGVGLVIVESATVDPSGRAAPRQLAIYEDEFVPGLARLARAIRSEGARAALQLHHAGRQTSPRLTGGQLVAPSALPCPSVGVTPRELSKEEIAHLVERFGEAARRAKEAGFEMVELHGAHGYLLAQFLSPYANRRTDEYGGSLEGRARFALEVVRRVRREVGEDFPISFRLSVEEHVEGGLDLPQSLRIARMLQEAGVDLLHVSAGTDASPEWIIHCMRMPPGLLVPLAAALRSRLQVPVAVAGRLHEPELAEQVLREGKADLVSLGRALIADPDLPRKIREGRRSEVRRCIHCNACFSALFRQGFIECTVNPEVGREGTLVPERAPRRRRILVVGGGPGGMAAAAGLAERGHQVVLAERGGELGGQLLLASRPPHKGELLEVVRYLGDRCRRGGVEVRLDTEVTPGLVQELRPEAVVLATGALPVVPALPGFGDARVVTVPELLGGRRRPGRWVVILGGGCVGCEVAELLAAQGHRVTIVEVGQQLAATMDVRIRKLLLSSLRAHGVRVHLQSTALGLEPQGLRCRLPAGEVVLPADTVVVAVGFQPNDGLADRLDGTVPCIRVGDCLVPRSAKEAILEGTEAALRL